MKRTGVFFVVMALVCGLPILAEDPAPPMPPLPLDETRARDLQARWAESVGLKTNLSNSLAMKLVFIPGGRFDRGPNGSKYRVTLRKPYYLGMTEVTMGQYRRFKPDHQVPGSEPEFNKDAYPVAQVSWKEARAFCTWLSEQPAEKTAGRVYSLPSEAQWEWAARAGTTTTRHFGDTDKGQAEHSWFNVTYTPNPKTERTGRGRHPVAELKPNAWGLYDMLGNVWEWCEDRHGDPALGEEYDPVMRGGSWRSGAFHCTAVAHDPGSPDQKGDNIGFRVACRIIKAS